MTGRITVVSKGVSKKDMMSNPCCANNINSMKL
jgi:hypothetical protein